MEVSFQWKDIDIFSYKKVSQNLFSCLFEMPVLFLVEGHNFVLILRVPPATKVNARVNLGQSNAFELGPGQRFLFRCTKHWTTRTE